MHLSFERVSSTFVFLRDGVGGGGVCVGGSYDFPCL